MEFYLFRRKLSEAIFAHDLQGFFIEAELEHQIQQKIQIWKIEGKKGFLGLSSSFLTFRLSLVLVLGDRLFHNNLRLHPE